MATKLFTRLLLVIAISAPICSGQSSGSSSSSSSGGGAQSGSQGLGFSIETEMLTYKSLEANSEAIACDIARRLFNGELGPPSATAPCTIQSGSNSNVGVVVVSSSSTGEYDFQLWRGDMASMNSLIGVGSKLCTVPPANGTTQSRGAPTAAASAAAAVTALTPFGQALPIAAGVVGMFASNETISPVTGTIHDEALMNGVARQLKALGISVLIPDLYNPYALGGVDTTTSPYLSNLAKLVDTRSCLQAKEDSAPKAQSSQPDEISAAISSIDAFLAKVTGGPSASSSTTPSAAARPSAATSTPAPATSTNSTTPTDTVPHLVSVLRADGLARAIGVGVDGNVAADSMWKHILWLKALESGGSVAKQGNILGNKTRYSGGAVSTYSLFNFDGNLDCSGNVYDYEGSVLTKNFSTVFREQVKNPTDQLASVHGSCGWSK